MSLEEIETLKTQCKQYVDDPDPEAILSIGKRHFDVYFMVL